MLVKYIYPDDRDDQSRRIPLTFVDQRPSTETLRLKEKVLEAKNSTYRDSRLSRMLMLEGFIMLALLLGYFLYRYGNSISSLNAFDQTAANTTRCL